MCKAKARVSEPQVSVAQAVDELTEKLKDIFVKEYSNPSGWRFPLFNDQQ